MYFKEITPRRYQVYKNKGDEKFVGIIERHDFISIEGPKRIPRTFWLARSHASGWKAAQKKRFSTREEAGAFLVSEHNTPYNRRKMEWDLGKKTAKKAMRIPS